MHEETAGVALYQPAPPVRLEFHGEPRHEGDGAIWQARTLAIRVALWAVEDDARIASCLACRYGTATRRLHRLAEITGDTRWMVIAEKLGQLQDPSDHFVTWRPRWQGQPMSGAAVIYSWQWTNTPAQVTVDAYIAGVRRLRGDIRQLCEESWPNSRPARELSGKRRDCPLISHGWLERHIGRPQQHVALPNLEPSRIHSQRPLSASKTCGRRGSMVRGDGTCELRLWLRYWSMIFGPRSAHVVISPVSLSITRTAPPTVDGGWAACPVPPGDRDRGGPAGRRRERLKSLSMPVSPRPFC
jgi:hypothetical protein